MKRVSKKMAELIIKLGYDKTTQCWYDNTGHLTCDNPNGTRLIAPCLEEVAEWLREDKGIALNIAADTRGQYQWSAVLLPSAQCQDPIRTDLRLHNSYNDALGAAVRSALNQLKKES